MDKDYERRLILCLSFASRITIADIYIYKHIHGWMSVFLNACELVPLICVRVQKRIKNMEVTEN